MSYLELYLKKNKPLKKKIVKRINLLHDKSHRNWETFISDESDLTVKEASSNDSVTEKQVVQMLPGEYGLEINQYVLVKFKPENSSLLRQFIIFG